MIAGPQRAWRRQPDTFPSPGALAEVRRLAGPTAVVSSVVRLEGGQEADTWRVDTTDPVSRIVVRQYPVGDAGAAREQSVLRVLNGLKGWAPPALGADLDGRWSERPTSLIGWLDGEADITPADPPAWAAELGRGLAVVHTVPAAGLRQLPAVFERETPARLTGPLAAAVLRTLVGAHRCAPDARPQRLLVGQRRLARGPPARHRRLVRRGPGPARL